MLLYDHAPIQLPARVAGDQPTTVTLVITGVEVRTDAPTDPALKRIMLESGVHYVRVDVCDADGVVVASGSKAVWVEQDPEEGGPDLPFEMRPRDSLTVPYPVWELEAPHAAEVTWVLWYARTHPAFRAALAADRAGLDGSLGGRRLFFSEIVCSALVEWALSLYREHGDESGFEVLINQAGETSGALWERYHARLEELREQYEEPLETLRIERDVVSLMLYVLQGDGTPVAA
jgi:hypothetical protein